MLNAYRNIEHYQHPRKFLYGSSPSQRQSFKNFFHHTKFCLFQNFIYKVASCMQYVLFCRTSFTHHSVFEISSTLLWLSVVCSFTFSYRIPLKRYCTVYLPVNGHLGCFQFSTIMNRTTKHYCRNLFVDVCFHFFLFLFDLWIVY